MAAATASDTGMVTAETAALLPLWVLLAALGLWLVSAAGTWLRCTAAADAAAAAAARGGGGAQVRQTAARLAPADATIVVTGGSAGTTVTVAAAVPAFRGPAGHWLRVTVRAAATG